MARTRSPAPDALPRRLDRLVVVQLWALVEAFQARLGAELSELDLTIPAFRLVGEVMRSPQGVRPGELARRLGVRAPTISAAVTRLEARGVVQRRDDPDDPRAYRVCLAEGAPLTAGVEILQRLEATLVEGLPPHERQALSRQLLRATERLRAPRSPA